MRAKVAATSDVFPAALLLWTKTDRGRFNSRETPAR
jgi:hypothetical protein